MKGLVAGPTRWAEISALKRELTDDTLVLADERVLRLHDSLARLLRRSSVKVLALRAGEGAKSLATLERVTQAAQSLTRNARLVVVGGGSLGDLGGVAAHLTKRGIDLVHVPTTALAAVDSSLGGKGALNVAGVKNAIGVFHHPVRTYLVGEIFSTLTERQFREGAVEAYKMAATLDSKMFRQWAKKPPAFRQMVTAARAMKSSVCQADPYETKGLRVVLNFGHTFGHVIESVTRFRLRHGEAVGLGMLCALDIGVAVGVTPAKVRDEVERALPNWSGARQRLQSALSKVSLARLDALLRADKKRNGRDVSMVLLTDVGRWRVSAVSTREIHSGFEKWVAR